MSRARNIKPGFFKNDLLAECNPLTRILFAGLWCEADREGRMEDRPKRLKAECLPYDECDIEDLLGELSDRGFIVRYSVEGKRYIAVAEFSQHQNPHQREVPSVIPAPAETKHNLGNDKAHPRLDAAEKCTGSAGLVTDSPSLIPDSSKSSLAPTIPYTEPSTPEGTPAGRACLLMRSAGCERVNPSNPDLLAALDEGVSPEALRDTYLESPGKSNPFAWAITTARNRNAEGAKPLQQARAGPSATASKAPPGKVMAGILRLEEMKNELAETRTVDRISNPDDARLGSSASR